MVGRLMTVSKIDGKAVLKALCDKTGEHTCIDVCENNFDKGCNSCDTCPIQKAFKKLAEYENKDGRD